MSLNQATLDFILDFEKKVEPGVSFTRNELVDQFKLSSYFQDKFSDYNDYSCPKSIGWAIRRSGKWERKNGIYIKILDEFKPQEVKGKLVHPPLRNMIVKTFNREEYIHYLSKRMFDSLTVKNQFEDEALRAYHFSSKAMGDELYFVKTTFFREKGLPTQKYKMADFISLKAKELIESGASLQNKLRFDHMVPKNLYFSKMVEATVSKTITVPFIYQLMYKFYYVCTVTVEEDALLLTNEMPFNWYKTNPFYRYELARIPFIPNLFGK